MERLTKEYRKGWSDDSVWIINAPGEKETLFYVQETGFFRCDSRYYTRQQGISSYVMMLTVKGQGELFYGGTWHRLPPGSFVFLDSMEPHVHRTLAEEGAWELYWVQFNGAAAGSYYRQFQTAESPVVLLDEPGKMERLFQSLVEVNRVKSRGSELLSAKYVVDLLTEALFAADAVTPPGAPRPDYVARACAWIDAHFSGQVTLEGLSRMTAVSKYHLIREFKRCTGYTPGEYAAMARISHAKRLLQNSGKSVAEIAGECGYATVSHFIRMFRQREGVTPLRFRRERGDYRIT